MQWKPVLCALALLLPTTSGCLAVADDDGPIMSIDLYWDARPNTTDFFGGTCDQADVRWMEWTLYKVETDSRGRVQDVEVAARAEPCADGIDVIEPEPGEYWLAITGLNEDDEPLWQADCPMNEDESLPVLRFDVAYACDVHAD